MLSERVARGFLSAFYGGDRASVRALMHDDFDFFGPFVKVRGADAFLDSAGPLLSRCGGHEVVRSWSDGDDICLVHEVTLQGIGEPIEMADWLTVREGRVAAERVFFDAARLRAALTAD